MAVQQTPGKPDQHDDGCKDCKDMDNATQVSMNANRQLLCALLYDTKGLVDKARTRFDGENDLYNEKKCIFIKTEENYQRFRNFDITAGTELIQTNDMMKVSVGQLKDWNKALNATLNNLFRQIKDIKVKFSDLKDAAYKLNNGYNEQCNSAQRKAITGKTSENCEDPQKPPEPCTDSGNQIDQLICIPKGLYEDAGIILKASSDVVGIQIFSNVDSLDQLQKDLADKSAAFKKHINDTMKLHKADVEKLQDELVISVKSITQAAIDRNSQRANFEGYYDATEFLCCPPCDCVPPEGDNRNSQDQKGCDDLCLPRLKDCESQICDICDNVKTTFCCKPDDTDNSKPPEVNYPKKSM
jgi:hypothetical protein